jgi:hypothetical protein
LWYQALGFLIIIALSWMDELLGLPKRFFGGEFHSNWHESAMESVVALAVWLPLFLGTKRMLDRLYYLEDFIRICAWCRKINDGDRWIPLEEYLSKGFDVKTSHGICPDCAKEHLKGKRGSAL